MTDYQYIDFHSEEHVATITLNRPKVSNSMNVGLLKELRVAVEMAEQDDNVRVVLLRAAGKNFCAGADLGCEETMAHPADVHLKEDHKPILLQIRNSRKTYICAVQGAAAGVGSAYVMMCDMTLMADTAYIYQAFVPIGLVPDGGATWLLGRNIGYKRAFKMIVEGTKLDAATCVDWGLASDSVPADELDQKSKELAHLVASKAPLAVAAAKQLLSNVFTRSYEDAFDAEADQQPILQGSEDAKEGVNAFKEKRKAAFRGV